MQLMAAIFTKKRIPFLTEYTNRGKKGNILLGLSGVLAIALSQAGIIGIVCKGQQ